MPKTSSIIMAFDIGTIIIVYTGIIIKVTGYKQWASNSVNNPVHNFGVDAYIMINSAGALVCKDC